MLGLSEWTVYRRLGVLQRIGLVEHERPVQELAGGYAITRAGLAVVGSGLPVPQIQVRTFRHDLLVADAVVALMAELPTHAVVTEREMRSWDGRDREAGEVHRPHGVPIGTGPRGWPRIHYPDALLTDPVNDRRATAVEVELSDKGRRRLAQIMRAYAGDRRIARLVYLTDRPLIADAIDRAARQAHMRDLVEIRHLDGAR